MQITIRNEQPSDHRTVEELTRAAFWNLYVPGCNEHYLAHIMRDHPDFMPELDFVAVGDNRVVGNIMYAKSWVIDADDPETIIDTISFGPISVWPEFQKQGIGSALIKHSLAVAKQNAHKAVIIHGLPHNYCKHGFKNGKDFGVGDSEGRYPFGLLALELEPGVFSGHKWKYRESAVYNIDEDATQEFDKQFPPREKAFRYTQEEFGIAVRAYLD